MTLIRVIDGDTIDVRVKLAFRHDPVIRVRLRGVNTPEIYGVKTGSNEYKAGLIATDFTCVWFTQQKDNQLYLQSYKTGKYGRWEGIIFSENDCLNNFLIDQGFSSTSN